MRPPSSSNLRVVSEAALGRAQRRVVVHAVAHEDFRPAVVHPHRDGHHERAPRVTTPDVDVMVEVETLRNLVELSHGGAVHLGFEFGHVGHQADSFTRCRSTASVRPSSG